MWHLMSSLAPLLENISISYLGLLVTSSRSLWPCLHDIVLRKGPWNIFCRGCRARVFLPESFSTDLRMSLISIKLAITGKFFRDTKVSWVNEESCSTARYSLSSMVRRSWRHFNRCTMITCHAPIWQLLTWLLIRLGKANCYLSSLLMPTADVGYLAINIYIFTYYSIWNTLD